jgi:BRO domain protein
MTNENLAPVLISGVLCYERDGTAYLRLEDVARGLGFTQTQNKNGVEYTSIRWETINRYLEEIGFPNKLGKDSYIPENIFYRLAMKAKNETAEKFQALVADEIIPSIRKTGSYSIVQADPNLPPELAMVEGLLNSMKQMYSTQQRHDKAIEQLTESMDTMKEVMTTDVNGDWRTACGHAIQAVARKLGGGKAYEEAWNEVYTEMERNGFFVRRRLENRKKSAAAQGMSPTYVRKLNALDIIADSKDKKLMSAFINATKKLAAAHSVRMDRLNELPAVEDQPEQTAFDRTCAPAGKLIDTRDATIRG